MSKGDTNIIDWNESLRDQCLLYLHKNNAYNIEITTHEQHISIEAKLPNQKIVTICCAHTFFIYPTTIQCEEETFEFDPTAEESYLLHFLI